MCVRVHKDECTCVVSTCVCIVFLKKKRSYGTRRRQPDSINSRDTAEEESSKSPRHGPP